MYCVVGTRRPDDHVGDHGYDTDKTIGGVDLAFDSSKCGDRMVNPEDPTQQISFDICDAMLAKHGANIADLKAAAADAAAELAALKAGLTCNVDENCEPLEEGTGYCEIVEGDLDYTCKLKMKEQGDAPYPYTAQNSTACAADMIEEVNGETRLKQPCEVFAAEQRALAEAEKTCERSTNCLVRAGNDYGGCILDFHSADPDKPATAPGLYGDDLGTEVNEARMYCVGTDNPEDDKSLLGLDLKKDSSSCGDAVVNPNDPNEQISFDICDATFAGTSRYC